MLAAERHAKIIKLIEDRGSVQVEELAKELGFSPMTIRRDLVKLQESDQIERCHGGAVAKQEVTYADKQTSHRAEKEALAGVCAQYVTAGDTIFLDAGTTTFEIAKKLQHIPGIMIVTNDLEIAQFLKNSEVDLVLCGGVVQKSTGSMLGYYTTNMLADFHFDIGFFGAASINSNYEVMTPTIDKAYLKRETVKRCESAYLVVDKSKFGKQAMNRINHLSDYEAVITDYILNEAQQKELIQLGVTIIIK